MLRGWIWHALVVSQAWLAALAEWAAAQMGLSGGDIDEYVKAVRKADLAEKGDDDVFRKVFKDLTDKGIKIADTDLRKRMHEFLAEAVRQIETQPRT